MISKGSGPCRPARDVRGDALLRAACTMVVRNRACRVDGVGPRARVCSALCPDMFRQSRSRSVRCGRICGGLCRCHGLPKSRLGANGEGAGDQPFDWQLAWPTLSFTSAGSSGPGGKSESLPLSDLRRAVFSVCPVHLEPDLAAHAMTPSRAFQRHHHNSAAIPFVNEVLVSAAPTILIMACRIMSRPILPSNATRRSAKTMNSTTSNTIKHANTKHIHNN